MRRTRATNTTSARSRTPTLRRWRKRRACELVRKDVLGEVSRAASDVGLDSSNPELTDVAKALSEVGLGD